MRPAFYLTIPEPCHEDWDRMTPAEEGRFCGQCEKVVYDFTAMADEELFRFLELPHHGICGRYRNDQLNRPIENPTPWVGSRIPCWQKIAACLAALGGLGAGHLSAQSPEMMGKAPATTVAKSDDLPLGGLVPFKGRVQDAVSPGRNLFASVAVTDKQGREYRVAVDTFSGSFVMHLNPDLFKDTLHVRVETNDSHFRNEYWLLKKDIGVFQEYVVEQVYRMDEVGINAAIRGVLILEGAERSLTTTMGLMASERSIRVNRGQNSISALPGIVRVNIPSAPDLRINRRGITVMPGNLNTVVPDGLELRLIPPTMKMGEITE